MPSYGSTASNSDPNLPFHRAAGFVHVPSSISWNGSNLSWTNRFIVIGFGTNDSFSPNGYINYNMPANGVVIPGYAGRAAVTVAGGAIPLVNGWDALWGVPPTDGGVTGSFAVSNYGNASTNNIPSNWIMLAQRNDDLPGLRLANGITLDNGWAYAATFFNGWRNYGAPYPGARWRKTNDNFVHLDGLIAAGTYSSSAPAFTLPVGFRPDNPQHFIGMGGGVPVGIRVQANGDVCIGTPDGAAGAGYIGLSGITFYQGG